MPTSTTLSAAFAAGLFATLATPALAELPPPVRALIEAAIATGDEAKVRTVIDLARTTNPADSAELDAILDKGAQKARSLAAPTIAEAKRAVGLSR